MRRSLTLLAPVALLAIILACKEKMDPTPLADNSDTWAKRDAEVTTRLVAFKERHDRMATDFEVANATADPLDSAAMKRRGSADSLLHSHSVKIAEIELRLSQLRAKRDTLKTKGDNEALERGWKDAEGEYGTIIARIDQLSADHDMVARAIGVALAPTPTDTLAPLDTPRTSR